MNFKKISILSLSVVAILYSGCGDGNSLNSQSSANSNNEKECKEFNLSEYRKTESLTQELKDSLSHMGNEERLAYDVYMELYKYHKENNGVEIKPLYNIATNSETKHISIVQDVVKRYELNVSDFTNVDESVVANNNMSSENMPTGVFDVPEIQNLYDELINLGQTSKENALKVGCIVEVTDINDLNHYIKQAEEANAVDIKAAFEELRRGSYKHYWAFDKTLKDMGVKNGCYYENDELLTNKKGIYPNAEKKEKGNGNK